MTEDLKKTPLYEEHRAVGARMGPFAGWAMPIQYRTIQEEHHHTRAHASVFDVSHMGEFDLTGPDAASDLDRLMTSAISTLAVGRCRYGYLLSEQGGVIDDLTCYRLGEDRFRLVVNAGTAAGDAEWIRTHVSGGTRFSDVSGRIAKVDIQGPVSRDVLEKAVGAPVPDLKFFGSVETNLGGADVHVSRSGYTGEWGYEIYLAPDDAVSLWRRLIEAGAKPAGLGARDTLRMEIGYPLYGQDLTSDRTPAGVSGGAFMDFSKEFIGRNAVEMDRASGPAQRLAGLKLETKRAARTGDRVLANSTPVGFVTSGSLAPSLGVAVALAWVRAESADEGTPLHVESRRANLSAVVTALPFYRDGTVRKKPA